MNGNAACQNFTSFTLTTLGTSGPNGPTSVAGYALPPPPVCPIVAMVPSGSGVQRFTVPLTGAYRLDVNGERTYPRLISFSL